MSKKEDEFQNIKKIYEDAFSANKHNYDRAMMDIRFARIGDQWDEAVRQDRNRQKKPCLTLNKLLSFIRQVVNDARQNRPGINVSPVDDKGDPVVASIIMGLIRQIERKSQAEIAYNNALDNAVTSGFGFFKIMIDYVSHDSFDMECKIVPIYNPLSVIWPPNSYAKDASDWDFCFVTEWVPKEVFKEKYPKALEYDFDTNDGQDFLKWHRDNEVKLVEYWKKEIKKENLFLLSNGATMWESQWKEQEELMIQGNILPKKQRMSDRITVKMMIVSGKEILEEIPWPGTTIPICPVWGDDIIEDGRRHLVSMVNPAIDAQRVFNFFRSASTDSVASATISPYIVEEGSIPAHAQHKWDNANTEKYTYLEYRQGSPIPQRQPFAGIAAGAIQEALNSSDDMKSIIGIYDAGLGNKSNEVSGKAILARQRESDVSNFHFVDNQSRAIRYCGKCLVEIIPYVYSERETIRILGEDFKEKIISMKIPDPSGQEGEYIYDLKTGTYDVSVEAGSSFTTQRQEAKEALLEIMRTNPGAGAILGDILVDNLDFKGANILSKRLKAMLPPQVLQAEMQENGQMNPNVQQMPQEMPNPQMPQIQPIQQNPNPNPLSEILRK